MRETYKLRFAPRMLLATMVLGCADAPLGGDTPFIVGPILSRQIDEMIVGDSLSITCGARARFWFTPDLLILRDGVQRDTSDLAVGRYATVFAEGAVLKSCTPITHAVRVLLK
jgi:hypothetical protein